jgi:hypothetical protein
MCSYWLHLSLGFCTAFVTLCCRYTKTIPLLSNAPRRHVVTVEDNRASEQVVCLILNPKIQHRVQIGGIKPNLRHFNQMKILSTYIYETHYYTDVPYA